MATDPHYGVWHSGEIEYSPLQHSTATYKAVVMDITQNVMEKILTMTTIFFRLVMDKISQS